MILPDEIFRHPIAGIKTGTAGYHSFFLITHPFVEIILFITNAFFIPNEHHLFF